MPLPLLLPYSESFSSTNTRPLQTRSQGKVAFSSVETGEPHKLEAKDVSHEDEDSEQQKDSYFFPLDSKSIVEVG